MVKSRHSHITADLAQPRNVSVSPDPSPCRDWRLRMRLSFSMLQSTLRLLLVCVQLGLMRTHKMSSLTKPDYYCKKSIYWVGYTHHSHPSHPQLKKYFLGMGLYHYAHPYLNAHISTCKHSKQTLSRMSSASLGYSRNRTSLPERK